MHQDDTHWTLLARYLAGESSAAERADIERRAAGDPAFAEELEALRGWWESAAALPAPSRVDVMWSTLHARMRTAGEPAAVSARTARRSARVLSIASRQAPMPSRRRALVALAAGLVLMATGGVVWRARADTGAAMEESRVYSTVRGQRATLRLGDGTRVDLGFASTLRVRPLDAGRREMWLEGEAVFEVVHDSLRPFLVHAAGATTEDLGTRFSVRAYPGDAAVRVVVVEGEVALRPRAAAGAAGDRGVVLGAGQLGTLDTAGRIAVQRGVDTSAYLSWLAGRVSFHDAPVAEIAAEIERRFDVSVQVPQADVAAMRLTVDMPARSLDEVLHAVTVTLGLRMRRAGDAVVLER